MNAIESLTSEAERIHKDFSADTFTEQRQQSLKQFQTQGFPKLRDEHWKYTDLRRITNKKFAFAVESNNLAKQQVDAVRLHELQCHELVFLNGTYREDYTSLNDLPDGVVICDMLTAIEQHNDRLQQHINISSDDRTKLFSTLNNVFLQQGCFIYIPDNVVLEKPINLLYLSGLNNDLITSQPRNIIVLGQNAQATIVESFIGLDESVYLTNSITELTLHANSHCQHYKLQQESLSAFHIGSLKVIQKNDSVLNSHSISLGAALARNDIHSQLCASGSRIDMNGLYMANGKQHIDNHTLVEHLAAHTYSDQVYHGVMNGHGRGVFNGKVIVHKDAQKIEANQSNANLLLSDTAEIDTKPELEIYADDVKCSHGATVGQLDENMLFYLRSRAIEEETAKSLLTFAFAEEVINKIAFLPIRNRLEHIVIGKLPDAELIQEFTHD